MAENPMEKAEKEKPLGAVKDKGTNLSGDSLQIGRTSLKNNVLLFAHSKSNYYTIALDAENSLLSIAHPETGGYIFILDGRKQTLTMWGNAYVNGNIEVTGDIGLRGADCAEEFDIATTEKIDSGTVLVIDEDSRLRPSEKPFDKKVAGVVSGGGGYKPGMILDRNSTQNKRAPIALTGKVYCKVDAQYSPIEVGDLLTTSYTTGHAMKADDPLKAFGAVIGKALASLREGTGLIPILVALQ